MPVNVKFHTKALQYERGQVVNGLTRSPVLDGLINRGHVEVLRETPDQPVPTGIQPVPEAPAAEDEPTGDEAAPEAPRRGRKRADDAD
ncbi:hypothetical protein GWI33_010010 [Rhynchophorus ferrugineus]|uniref:Uncharacterized protein n=1 Tax=Rhynchophorus ferrugineus TaxID=354439 RepID=A0A834I8S0_RHYFE|nr:hypothetical protein GWI33_010010 [Rhynchophorus ferrugineus]